MLVLNVPTHPNKKGIQAVLSSGVAEGYILHEAEKAAAVPGATVVVLNRDSKIRSEGILRSLPTPNGFAGNNKQRYDLVIYNLKVVPFKDETFNANGVCLV